jgi:hypothetical protein
MDLKIPSLAPRDVPRDAPGALTLEQARARVAEFLQDYPLYTPLQLGFAEATKASDLCPRAISRACTHCRATTTWLPRNPFFHQGSATFWCAQCGQTNVEFRFKFAPSPFLEGGGEAARPHFTIRKYGQWPGWSISPPREIEAALDAVNLDLYKKALVCMSQAYGLGAVAYFRRVIENELPALLDLVEEAATADADEEALDTVRRARESRIADEKLRLVADHVPRTLRPGGANPLAILYDQFSRGIHALSDEDCLAVAMKLRSTFDFVFKNLRQLTRDAKEYAAQIAALAANNGRE